MMNAATATTATTITTIHTALKIPPERSSGKHY
jgi:hypothetical protein